MKKITTEYFYNDDERLSRAVTTEVADCPDCDNCNGRDEGELLTGEVELTDGKTTLEILLTAAIGALFGNLLYHTIRNA